MLCWCASSSDLKGLCSHRGRVTLMTKALHCFKPLRSTRPESPVSHPRRSYSGEIPTQFGPIGRGNFSHWTNDRDWPVTVRPISAVVCPPTFSSEDWKRSFLKLALFFFGITTYDLQVHKASNLKWNQSWSFKSSWMWCCVVQWRVTDASQDHSAFILRLKQSRKSDRSILQFKHHDHSKYQQLLNHHIKDDRRHQISHMAHFVSNFVHTHKSGHQICR